MVLRTQGKPSWTTLKLVIIIILLFCVGVCACVCIGFRHVPLRNMSNQALELSTLFAYFHVGDDWTADLLPSPGSVNQSEDRSGLELRKASRATLLSKSKEDATSRAEREVVSPQRSSALSIQERLYSRYWQLLCFVDSTKTSKSKNVD